MQMDIGLDTGDMLLEQRVPIGEQDTTAKLHDTLADLGADLVVQALRLAAAGQLRPVKQPPQGVTYAHKIEKHEAALDWGLPAPALVHRVRAFNPFPGASATLNGEVLKVWSAQVGDAHVLGSAEAPLDLAVPGLILAVAPAGIAVAAMNSIVVLTELQRPGGKRLAVADFLRGFDVRPGMCFDLPPSSASMGQGA
jgi:methionyl-tRNA formyltransferase